MKVLFDERWMKMYVFFCFCVYICLLDYVIYMKELYWLFYEKCIYMKYFNCNKNNMVMNNL